MSFKEVVEAYQVSHIDLNVGFMRKVGQFGRRIHEDSSFVLRSSSSVFRILIKRNVMLIN